jgi:hypothetical protein
MALLMHTETHRRVFELHGCCGLAFVVLQLAVKLDYIACA